MPKLYSLKGRCSNNTNKLSPQEHGLSYVTVSFSSNNTNKLSPQEQLSGYSNNPFSSNNTNKLSPQEPQPLNL